MASFFNDPILNNAANLHQQITTNPTVDPQQQAQDDAINAQLDAIQNKIQPAVNTANTNARLINASVTGQLTPRMGNGQPIPANAQMGGAGGEPAGTPEQMVKLRNNSTGQIIMVPQSQVPFYTGSPSATSQPSQPAIGSGQPATGSQVTTNSQAATFPGAINPQGTQESSDQLQAQQMWRNATNLQQQDNIASQWSASHGYDLFGLKPLNAQQTDLQTNTKQGNIAKQGIQQALDAYSNAPHGGTFQGFFSNLPNQGGQKYNQLKDALGDWGKDMPNTGDNTKNAQESIQALDNKLRTNYGYSLDSKYLQSFGLTRDQNGNAVPIGSASTTANKGEQAPQQDTTGKIISGAVGDLGALAHAPIDLGKTLFQNTVKEKGNFNNALGDTAVQLGKGVVNEYGQLVGAQTKDNQPILPQDKSVFQSGGVNVPTGFSGQAAVQHLENHPINSLLDVAPIAAKGISALKGASGAEEAANAAKASSIPGASPTDAQVKSFASNFIVPQKRAMGDLNLMGTSKEILQHIDSGMNPNDLKSIPEQVTGDHGVITSMTRDAVGKLEGNAQLTPIQQSAQDVLDRTTGISSADEAKVMRDITKPFNNGKSGNISEITPQDLYDHARSLFSEAADYKRQDSYITPNKSAAGIAKAYTAAGNEIMNQLEQMGKDKNVLSTVITPDRIAALQKISPRLAAQVQHASSIGDLRRAAAPFVKLDQINDLTDSAANSTFGKVANQMTGRRSGVAATGGRTMGSIVGGLAGSPLGPMGTMAGERIGGAIGGLGGMMIDKGLTPQYQKAAETVIPKVQGMARFTGNGIKNAGKAAKLYGNTAKMARFTQQGASH